MLPTSTADNRRLERFCHEFSRRRHHRVRRFLRAKRLHLPATRLLRVQVGPFGLPILAVGQCSWTARASGCDVAQSTRRQSLTSLDGLRPWSDGRGRSLLPLSHFSGCNATRRLRDDPSASHPSSLHPWMSHSPCRAPHADGPWHRARRTSGRSRRSSDRAAVVNVARVNDYSAYDGCESATCPRKSASAASVWMTARRAHFLARPCIAGTNPSMYRRSLGSDVRWRDRHSAAIYGLGYRMVETLLGLGAIAGHLS